MGPKGDDRCGRVRGGDDECMDRDRPSCSTETTAAWRGSRPDRAASISPSSVYPCRFTIRSRRPLKWMAPSSRNDPSRRCRTTAAPEVHERFGLLRGTPPVAPHDRATTTDDAPVSPASTSIPCSSTTATSQWSQDARSETDPIRSMPRTAGRCRRWSGRAVEVRRRPAGGPRASDLQAGRLPAKRPCTRHGRARDGRPLNENEGTSTSS